MNIEFEQKMYDQYPDLFSNKDKTPQESCMSFGIECGDGWYDILDGVCSSIKNREENLKNRKKYSPEFVPDLIPVTFDQIKEKFGGLRIYYSGGDDYIRGIISMAEAMSYKICEVCGNGGTITKIGWMRTLCEQHKVS
jgi:hypothetical protein